MTRKGYKQTPEHIAKRIGKRETHARWIGDSVSVKGGRTRALRIYSNIGKCERCGAESPERHHVDGNTANNSPSNIRILCRKCHMTEDGRLAVLVENASKSTEKRVRAAIAYRLAMTVCKRGHPLSGDNIRISPKGARVCKKCSQIAVRKYLNKKKGIIQ
jgi:hypothetical protein